MTDASIPVLPVRKSSDIPIQYRDTAISDLLAYHNLDAPHRRYTHAEILIGMCMDNRLRLRIPTNFAYVMRAAGANFRELEFQMSYAIAVGGVRAIAIIGHDQCGMSGLSDRRDSIIAGLVEGAGWEQRVAEQHYEVYAPQFEIGNTVQSTSAQVQHLQQLYPSLAVAALHYTLDDGMLCVIE